ncbi:MAG: adenylosuccinate lyase [Deltaproteobacteria bacterium]|nr:adenylosuccinate lyase [Deltaproteobacteria bacterium]
MIPRYSHETLVRLWSDAHRLRVWLDVEIAVTAAWEARGQVPGGTAARLSARARDIDTAALAARQTELEQTTQHDVIAFLQACEELLGDDARWLHFGMTSSDVVDTAFALLLREAGTEVLGALDRVPAALRERALEHKMTPCLGRTHGQAAEPTTFGLKLLSSWAELSRGRARLLAALEEVRTGKIAGAVGNYGNVPPDVEAAALSSLGLTVEPVATQVVPRDRHAVFFSTLAVIAGGLERLAVEVRHLQRTEVKEAFEPFGKGQRGSSAMPHKKNPILSENLTGLCRLLRGYAGAALEDIALWHERDISHSSVERVIAPDATTALHFALLRTEKLVRGLVVDPARMAHNLAAAGDIVGSGAVLLALVERGVPRQEAYGWVQRCALGGGDFKKQLAADAEVSTRLTAADVDRLLSVEHHLRHVDAMFARVLGS